MIALPVKPGRSQGDQTDHHWIALSDHAGPVDPAGIADLVHSGSLVLELTAPKQGGSVLLDYRRGDGWPRAFSIFHDPDAGIVILHRQGSTVRRHHLPGPLPQDWNLARLIYSWDGPAREWSLRLEDTMGIWAHAAAGTNPMPLAGGDLLAFCAGPNAALRDASLHWFGFCLDGAGTVPATWIGQRTPVDTARGTVAAGDLAIGDLVMTLDNGHKPLRALHRMNLPNRGSYAPVLLRAPYFARHADMLVAPGQLTLLSGAAVEYLFGEDAVLATAASLRDGNSALSEARRAMTACVALDLGQPELILADGCPLLVGRTTATSPLPYRLLNDYETRPLHSQLGRGGQRTAA